MNYHIYTLRVWKEESENSPNQWRMSVENSVTGTRVGFVDWQSMMAYLQKQTGDTTPLPLLENPYPMLP